MHWPKLELHDGIVYRRFDNEPPRHSYYQLVVPRALRFAVLQGCHVDYMHHHYSVRQTFNRVRSRYFWLTWKSDTERFRCRVCEKFGRRQEAYHRPSPTTTLSINRIQRCPVVVVAVPSAINDSDKVKSSPWIVIPSDEAETGITDSRDAATSTQDLLDLTNQVAPIDFVFPAAMLENDEEMDSEDERELQEILRTPPTDVYRHKSIQRPVAISPPLSPISEGSEAAEDLSDDDMEMPSRPTLTSISEEDELQEMDTDITYRKTVDTDSDEEAEMPHSFTETVDDEPRSRRPTREHRLPARYRD